MRNIPGVHNRANPRLLIGALGIIAASPLAARPLAAQAEISIRSGPRELLPRAREVALARSAAPPEVSGQATVLALESDGYAIAEEGSNGVVCYVNRSWRDSLEPHCFDEEASATILPMQLRRAELRQQGVDEVAIEAELAAGLSEGRFRLPRRPAMSYMMSAGQVLYNNDGEYAGAWKPHLMIYYPFLGADELGLSGPPSTAAAVVTGANTATSSIMIVVETAIDPGVGGGEGGR